VARHHVPNILAKLAVTNCTEAVHLAMQRGLLE
jgi:DNA-binding CsgD family transcriptional regulator